MSVLITSRLIGSVAVTVPSATWLWSQGPIKSDHGSPHYHGEEGREDQTAGAPNEQPSEDEEAQEEAKANTPGTERSEEQDKTGTAPKKDQDTEGLKSEGNDVSRDETGPNDIGKDKVDDSEMGTEDGKTVSRIFLSPPTILLFWLDRQAVKSIDCPR